MLGTEYQLSAIWKEVIDSNETALTPDVKTPQKEDNSYVWVIVVVAVLLLGGIGFIVFKRKISK